MATTIEIPAMVMAVAAEAGKQLLKDLIEQERNVDGFTDNAEELAATNALFDSLLPETSIANGSISFSISNPDSEWGETIEHGTDPVAGGQGGMVTHPDGSQEPSRVPPQLWGTPLPWLQTAGTMWLDNVMTKARTLIPERVTSVISEYSSEIGEAIAPYITERLAAALGGGT